MAVVLAYRWYDGYLSLDSEMEGTLFEGQESGCEGVCAGAFDEDVYALSAAFHFSCGAVEGGAGRFRVGAVDEDGFAGEHCAYVSVSTGDTGD